MPDTPRYVTHRSGLYVQVLDLGPVQECLPAKTVATCSDSTSAATVALALNLAHDHDVDGMARTIAALDDAVVALADEPLLTDAVTDSTVADARARKASR